MTIILEIIQNATRKAYDKKIIGIYHKCIKIKFNALQLKKTLKKSYSTTK